MLGWDQYVDLLKGHESILAQTVAPQDEQLRADLLRQFAMNLSQGYFLLFQADPDYPEFVPFENSTFLLQPNPDAVYYYTRVDGAGTYRVRGQRGTAPVVGLSTGARIIGTSDIPGQGFGNFDVDSLTIDAQGNFNVLFSAQRPEGYEGDWRELHPDADFILLRQFNYDWGQEQEVRIAIERLDRPAGSPSMRPRMAPEEVDRRMRDLFAYAKRLSQVGMGAVRRPHDQGFINAMHLHDFKDLGNGEDWPQAYFETVFDLADDEVLVLESELPEERHYWNVQVVDGLWNQVDVAYRQSSLNGHTARLAEDGMFRAVLSPRDPGYANWLDTGDHRFGMLIGRWYRCSSHPTPKVTKLKQTDVAAYLGDSTPRITPDERAVQLRERLVASQLRRKW
ncbi:DUF1214 domain-containing protein [Novosphingobium malaysiense]|uniref:DUF1214 domain-containing protein n=1 Tax=Novosphingobium malaysiense TaxID=1348853 RepID=A0A0B1ZF67_9SPHN|nr:DUF1214 domain-containing protein [Novosphingobium malaysiense]KHK89115.1 hypothetical protein LK12_22590 [Novosphingobium malaysiense]